jgi:hypothetical protein
LVSHTEGGTKAEGVREQAVEGVFGPKTDEVTGKWRRLHKEELNALYSSPNIIPVIKSRGMRWARYVVRMGRGEVYIGFWWVT